MPAKLTWRLVLGVLSTIYGIGRAILDAIGYVDLVIAHHESKTETWLGKLINILLAPSWTILPFVAVGLLLIWWDVRRRPSPIHHEAAAVDHDMLLQEALLLMWERIRTIPKYESYVEHYESKPATMMKKLAQLAFAADPQMPLYGVNPPRTVIDRIPPDDIGGWEFSDDASYLYDKFWSPDRRYQNLRISRSDIERVIVKMSAGEPEEASAKALVASTKATETLVNIERAYLTGGGDVDVNEAGERCFRVEVANYGKTPAYLFAFDVQFATLEDVKAASRPVSPVYHHDDRIPPTGETKVIDFIPITPPDANVVYGAFWYRDIRQKPDHIFRFILRIGADDHTRPDISGVVDKRYTHWD